MKIMYFGTPDFAVKPLQKLIENFEVVAVVTQPDRPVGRSNKLVATPVKQCAISHGIPVLQFDKVKNHVEELKKYPADMMVSCAFGQFFTKEILDMSPLGLYNIHGSILPKYRGASPIQWSIINGEKYSGITILKTDIGCDDGDILLTREVEILKDETSEQLFDRLSVVGADLIVEAVKILETGKYTLVPQDHQKATMTHMLSPELSDIDFNRPAKVVASHIHGINPWPVAKIQINGTKFKVFKVTERHMQGEAGRVLVSNAKQGLIIACKENAIEILELQPENGKRMTAKSYLNGKSIPVGEKVNE